MIGRNYGPGGRDVFREIYREEANLEPIFFRGDSFFFSEN